MIAVAVGIAVVIVIGVEVGIGILIVDVWLVYWAVRRFDTSTGEGMPTVSRPPAGLRVSSSSTRRSV